MFKMIVDGVVACKKDGKGHGNQIEEMWRCCVSDFQWCIKQTCFFPYESEMGVVAPTEI